MLHYRCRFSHDASRQDTALFPFDFVCVGLFEPGASPTLVGAYLNVMEFTEYENYGVIQAYQN